MHKQQGNKVNLTVLTMGSDELQKATLTVGHGGGNENSTEISNSCVNVWAHREASKGLNVDGEAQAKTGSSTASTVVLNELRW